MRNVNAGAPRRTFFENCQKSRQQGLADEEWVGLREGASEPTPVSERSTEWPIEKEDEKREREREEEREREK